MPNNICSFFLIYLLSEDWLINEHRVLLPKV